MRQEAERSRPSLRSRAGSRVDGLPSVCCAGWLAWQGSISQWVCAIGTKALNPRADSEGTCPSSSSARAGNVFRCGGSNAVTPRIPTNWDGRLASPLPSSLQRKNRSNRMQSQMRDTNGRGCLRANGDALSSQLHLLQGKKG